MGVALLWVLAAVLIPRIAARREQEARVEMVAVLRAVAAAQLVYAADHDRHSAPALSMLPAGTVPIGAVTIDLVSGTGFTWQAHAVSTRSTTRCTMTAGDPLVPAGAVTCDRAVVVNTSGAVRYDVPVALVP